MIMEKHKMVMVIKFLAFFFFFLGFEIHDFGGLCGVSWNEIESKVHFLFRVVAFLIS